MEPGVYIFLKFFLFDVSMLFLNNFIHFVSLLMYFWWIIEMGAGHLSLYLDYTVKGHHPDSRENANSIEKCSIFDKFPTIRLVAA